MDPRLEPLAQIRRGRRLYEVGEIDLDTRQVSLLNVATGYRLSVPVLDVVSPEYQLVLAPTVP